MKDITHYFVDPVKSSEDTPVNSSENTKQETHPENGSRGKRNRVKIKISRRSTDERVCDIIESKNDMVDKTPSPFAKLNNVSKGLHDGTPKRSSLSELSPQSINNKKQCSEFNKPQILADVNYTLAPNCNVEGKQKRVRGKSNSRNSLADAKGCENKVKDKHDEANNVSLGSSPRGEANVCVIELTSSESDGEADSQREESDAFQILMNRSKPVSCVSPTQLSPQDTGTSVKKSEELREKLKRSKEKLIVLADKKGYSKRKLAELEEGEKIEQAISNRIKAFKGDEKKDNASVQTPPSQKPLSSSLLNYFSKTPQELAQKNQSDTSTFVVTADVHISDGTPKQSLQKSVSNNKILPSKTSKKSGAQISEVDDICVIASECINVSNNNVKEQSVLERKKSRWSLRIKLQTNENEDSVAGNSSDEEIYSPRSKVKLGTDRLRKSETFKPTSSDESELSAKSTNKKREQNGHAKLRLNRKEKTAKAEQKDVIIQDDSDDVKKEVENSRKVTKAKNSEKKLSDSAKHKADEHPKSSNSDSTKINKVRALEEDCRIVGENSSKRKSNEKLAPLFTKRRKPDPETVAARRLFLQPDITDSESKTGDRKLNICSTLPFPIISHVTQLNGAAHVHGDPSIIPIRIKNPYVPTLNANNYRYVTSLHEKKLLLKNVGVQNVQDVQETLTEIEGRCSDARKMWSTISLLCKKQPVKKVSPKGKSRRGKSFDKKETVTGQKSEECNAQSSIWTQKYKPTSTQEIVGNEEAAAKLKDWLDRWRSTLTNEDVSSGDEFYSSDCSYSSSNENNQVAVLLGPHGSGKSASVYAVAEELGYTVLEVNASSRRTGKKLLKELEEATKSHRIKKDKGKLPMFNSVPTNGAGKKIPQNSLILLEDIDLIFEEDEGFVSATYQLASNTKRPIVITCRDVCPHLNKMAPQQNRIYFQNVVGDRVSALLELISLAETGHKLSHGYAAELLRAGDLRKALLQLQYLLLSGPSQLLQPSTSVGNSLWQNMRYYLYKPAIKASRKGKAKKGAKSEMMHSNTTDALNSIANKLDDACLISSLIGIDDPALNFSHLKMQPSLSLMEDISLYTAMHGTSSEIVDWLAKTSLYRDQLNESDAAQSQNSFILRKQLNKGVDTALSHVTSLVLDRQTISIDYLPSVRTICRSEECRSNMNSKRGNRFFHYLQGLKVPNTSLKPNILAAACKAMQEKADGQSHGNASNSNVV